MNPNNKAWSQKIVIEKEHSHFPIIFVLASNYRAHSVLPCHGWFLSRGSRRLNTCGRGQGGFRFDGDMYTSNRAQRIFEILEPPFFWASLVF
jgi:hypothetical protein